MDAVRNGQAQAVLGHHHRIGPGVHLIPHRQGPAQGGKLKGHVHQVMEAGGNQHPLQKAIEEQAAIPCGGNPLGQAVHRLLHRRPDKTGGKPQRQGQPCHAEERQPGPAVNPQGCRPENRFTGVVVDPAGEEAQDHAPGDPHVHRLNPQHGGLAGAIKAQAGGSLGQLAQLFQHRVARRQKDQIGKKGNEGCLVIVLPGQEGGHPHTEQDAQILHDGPHAVVHQVPQQDQGFPPQNRDKTAQPGRRQQGAQGQQQPRHRQAAQGSQHGGGKFLQGGQHALFWLHPDDLPFSPF